ncbi:hypothetical protein O7626_40845 [Micromonospora sp. WMMD1102]|uniref:hypothetical protein n=1 Tax=Micromonospora sp. WMMD1102 TaxID=3016105 RepID=UPI0024150585|nr:hypothetical protein [Micromonospora sp. WMMD1102]MDG4790350.1 hypothetical protein [Micromonospora sp. WMMD1102]MDG4792153.1 hypothetical protein [Micromonospora sp. WMMD1102]
MTEEEPNFIARHLRWPALVAAVALTAKGEYDLARMAHYGEWMAVLFPISIDVYSAAAFLRHRTGDVLAGLALMIGCQIAVHLLPLHITGEEKVPWGLVIAISCIPPIVAWRAHALGTKSRAEKTKPEPSIAEPVSGMPDIDATDVDVRDASFDPWSLAEPARDASLPVHADASLGDPFDVPAMRHPMPEVTRHDTPALPASDARLTYPALTHPARRTVTHRINGSDASPGDGPDGSEVTRQPEPVKTRRGPKPGKDERMAEVLRLVEEDGMSARAAAKKVGIDEQAAQRYVRKHRTNGHTVGGHGA